ncbi:Right handed beta helix region [Thiothrix eikelboomii]|uniref:Right handed beta helix region n=1 Tax=Thiothrix eikelboomii TaxID=92487 RepID=A0A1T4WLW2_9GAMM|nr:right-handed parallel beta-helix repeat-containing protein [Thiothrix eikelboomii]SKA78350.1 Right handed beta helix region [Thiothrix eikelboomii]
MRKVYILLLSPLLWADLSWARDNLQANSACAALNGQTVQVKANMVLPAACTLRDTRFVFENVQNVSLDLNGSTLVSDKLMDAIRFTTTDPQRPSRNLSVKNGRIKGYGTALYVHRHLSPSDLQNLVRNPQGYYPYIQQTATRNVMIDNLQFLNPRGTAVYVWVGNSKVTLKNSKITAAQGPAVYLDTGSFANVIVDNVITHSGFLDPQGKPKQGRGLREAIAIDGSYNNRIARNTLTANARGGVHLYANCGEKVHSDPNYVPRIFEAKGNLIRNNRIQNNGAGGAVEIGKRVDWNLEDWDCAKPVYASFLTFKYYWDNSGHNRVEANRGNGVINVRTDNNTLVANAQTVEVDSLVRRLKGDDLVNNKVSP